MKRLSLSIITIFTCLSLLAQVPESFNYQVVVRDGSTNNPLVNQNVSFKMSILKGSSSGESQYSELHSANTGALGIVNLVIGNGTDKAGTISAIDWGSDTYYLKVEIDKTGGTNYVEMGTTQLLSVPYALNAKNATTSADAVKLTGDQTIAGNKTFTGTISVPPPVSTVNAVTKEYVDALMPRITALENVIQKADLDKDGFTILDGDCNDNDDSVYPGAQESCNDGIDQDCNGSDLICENFQYNSLDPLEAAKSIGIYNGLSSANWVLPDGSSPGSSPNFPIGHGILNAFGLNVGPLEGNQFLALSTGTARLPADPGYADDYQKGYSISFPAGFPQISPSCPTPTTAYDGVALKLALTVPDNINYFSFHYKFYTKDYPDWICSVYNDIAIVTVSPYPAGSYYGNVLFDSQANPLSVNSGETITCCSPSAGYTCANGTSELQGTGFDSNAGTTWNKVKVPVQSGAAIVVTFAIWDSQDNTTTSTLLLDNWEWEGNK